MSMIAQISDTHIAVPDAPVFGAIDTTACLVRCVRNVFGIAYMDKISLAPEDAARLAAVVRRCPAVERISCGHVHRAVSACWSGTVVGICPSAAFQDNDDFRLDARVVWTDEQPAYQLHYWDGGDLKTHTHQIPAGA